MSEDAGLAFSGATEAREDAEGIEDVDQAAEVIQTPYDITSYGADYDVEGLVKRLDREDIVVPSFEPRFKDDGGLVGFQRRFVWKRTQMDRFIESLLLGLPVPGIFLLRYKENQLLVLDGQQRLLSLQFYYSGIYGEKRYKLAGVDARFENRSYDELELEDRRRLDDSIIHATVLRQNSEDGSQDAVYSIFERLNSGGSALYPQEIRVALYPGRFLQAISDMNSWPSWRRLYGQKPSERLKDHELILRVFAMYEGTVEYKRPLKKYLSDYLIINQNRELTPSDPLRQTFQDAMDVIARHIGPNAFRPIRPLNVAVLDSISVAIMGRLERGPITEPSAMKTAYDKLILDKEYRTATVGATADGEPVKTRIAMATEAFAGVA
jgi:hypothetical protein